MKVKVVVIYKTEFEEPDVESTEEAEERVREYFDSVVNDIPTIITSIPIQE